ncbi:hypothetical protein M8C21_024104 [Ambrosia artemisiifolia]|uniref:Uncharacterized protein n=1 Tax=Ambrosia artemisiifolia TaxID=4212 RepID=A0AAD5CXW7_AMBAR|nr:hypothetical protein M8C21_024104 [Ambrosia artemisiifolia]
MNKLPTKFIPCDDISGFLIKLGSFYTWTCTYQMIQRSALRYNALKETGKLSNEANKDLAANQNTRLLNKEYHDHIDRIMPLPNSTNDDTENQRIVYQGSAENEEKKVRSFSDQSVDMLKKILEQLFAPLTHGSSCAFGAVFSAIELHVRVCFGSNKGARSGLF